MGSIFGSSSAEKAAAKASSDQARQMRENAERDRQQALYAQQAAQMQAESLAARERAQQAAAALLTETPVEEADVELNEDATVEAEVDPEIGRRRRPRDAYQAPATLLTGLKI